MLLLGHQNFAVAAALFLRRYIGAAVAVGMLWLLGRLYGVNFTLAYVALVIIVGLLGVIFLRPSDASEFYVEQPLWQRAGAIGGMWLLLCGVLLLLGFATKTSEEFSRRLILSWAVVTPVAILGARIVIGKMIGRLIASERLERRSVIAGASDVGQDLAARISAGTGSGIRVDGFFEDRNLGRLGHPSGVKVLGSLTDLPDYVKEHNISIVFIALPIRNVERVTKVVDDLQDTTASLYFVPDVFVFDLIQSRAVDVLGIHALALCETPFYGYRGALKRSSDILISLLALAFLSPLLVAIAIAIKATSPGSVIFKQRRYGLDGHEITVYKFRSMTVSDDDDNVPQARRDDPRVTPVGAVLRKYSLDELPQFFNVLQGRMSVVGPRPHAVAHNEQYRRLIKGYMVRHKVAPGITGLAQVTGYRGETDTIEKMHGRIEKDLEYLRNWSLALDLRIILKTALIIFTDKKAY